MTQQQAIVKVANEFWANWHKFECRETKENVIVCNGNGKMEFVTHKDGNSWCAAFVSTVINEVNRRYGANITLLQTASTSAMRASAIDKYRVDKLPFVGSVFYRRYSSAHCAKIGSYPGCGHVGIVVGFDAKNNKLTIIEGNAQDKILKSTVDADDFIDGNSSYPDGNFFIHIEGNFNEKYTKLRNYYLS